MTVSSALVFFAAVTEEKPSEQAPVIQVGPYFFYAMIR